jgi:alanine-glyoxylate transaminase/(R)-3-amino-2-methylpropionate-pyruvate transaminase
MAKGIGNGLPLAAVVTTPEIAKTLAARTHFNTFGGNPVCCAAGRAVLQAIDEDRCQETSAKVGGQIKQGLQQLMDKHDVIGDVRGDGLMLGFELVKDRHTKEPAKAEVAHVWERCKDKGVLIGKGGLYGNAFRIKPPMCITSQDADFLLEVLDVALSEL